jgi:hypothetical protein
MRHLSPEAGIAVVTVPARNTSKHCPQCLVPLRHRKAPDRPTVPGWKKGRLLLVRLAGRPWPGCLAAHRRTRTHPPGANRHGPHQRRHGDPQRGRQTRSPGSHHAKDQSGQIQDRPDESSMPDAQATPDTLPRSGGPASEGTRSHGPDPAASCSPPEPGRDDDQLTPSARRSPGCGFPPARPRLPSPAGTRTRHWA